MKKKEKKKKKKKKEKAKKEKTKKKETKKTEKKKTKKNNKKTKKKKKNRKKKCADKVTLKCLCTIIVGAKKRYLLHTPRVCVCRLRYLAGTAHYSYLPAYEDGTECSETSAYKIQTPGN